MALQGVQQSPRPNTPQANDIVPTATGQDLPIRTERHAEHSAHMAFQGAPYFTCGQAPQMHGAVIASAGQDLAIRTEGHAQDAFRVTLQDVQEGV